jgi:hypothetical protein
MRWIKLIAILSLGLFFFGVLVVLHLGISLLSSSVHKFGNVFI